MFRNDYSELCAKEVLTALNNSINEKNIGYGLDKHSENAKNLILDAFEIDREKGDVFFLAGGTQTNVTVISYFLRPYESVISCDTGHINVHETGALEGTGHKINTVQNTDGKLYVKDIQNILDTHLDEHMVKPKMAYISLTTEKGTSYTLKELTEIRKICDKYGLLLFIDGARLAVALTLKDTDLTPKTVSTLADIFYVGGTKNGAMYGEAVVVKDKNLVKDFRYHIKNRCSMLAKGFAVAIQFETLFTNGLYFELAKNSNAMAEIIRNGLIKNNIELVGNSKSNQIFIKVSEELGKALMEKFGLEFWSKEENGIIVRIVTSFSTTKTECEEFIEYIENYGR